MKNTSQNDSCSERINTDQDMSVYENIVLWDSDMSGATEQKSFHDDEIICEKDIASCDEIEAKGNSKHAFHHVSKVAKSPIVYKIVVLCLVALLAVGIACAIPIIIAKSVNSKNNSGVVAYNFEKVAVVESLDKY